MSTHATIGILHEDGTVEAIYSHSDGYPQRAGVILNDYWDTAEKVRKLIAEGDCSILGREIGEKHDFGDYYRQGHARRHWCKFYGRDRNEHSPAAKYSTLTEALDESCQYFYVFSVAEERWLNHQGGGRFGHLSTLVGKIKAEGKEMIE